VLQKVVFICLYFCSVDVQQLSHWRSCTAVGHRLCVGSLFGPHALKRWEPSSLTPLFLHIFIKICYVCSNQDYVLLQCNIHTTLNQCWKSWRAIKILSAGHMWSVGLQLDHAGLYTVLHISIAESEPILQGRSVQRRNGYKHVKEYGRGFETISMIW